MPPKTAPSPSPRSSLALRGLVLALVLAGLAFALHRRGAPTAAPALRAPSGAERASRSPPRVDAATRPRAGIAGRVVDPDHRPVAAASVCVWAQAGNGLSTSETQAPRCARSDRAGAYAINDLFPATPLTLSASAPSFAPTGYRGPKGDAEIRLADGEQRAGVDVVLRRGGVAAKGSVSDVTGGAVAGAVVVAQDGADRAVATSDAKGEFTLWIEPGPARIGATATGYAPGWAFGPAPDHFFKINLVPGATLVGRAVVAGSQTPVAGAIIDSIQMEGGGTRASTKTSAEGRFQIEGLTPGRYRVEANAEGRAGYSRTSTTLGMGETSSEVLIELDPAYVVRGRVVDKATGEPCPAGQVTITDPKQNEYSQATIEPDGWARMASVIPGTYKVQVACKDHVERDDYPTVVIQSRDAPPLTWEVDKGATVRVEVVDGQGRPITKASVSAYPTEPHGSSGYADHAEADGAFAVSGLKPGGYNVTVYTPESGRGNKQVTASPGRDERVRIELPDAGIIDGIVEDDAHRPVPNMQVSASGPGHASARSLDDGTFSLTGLPSGDYEVQAGDRRMRRGVTGADDARTVKVTVAAPARARVKVTVEARNGAIAGRVTDGAGKPVTDAFIDCVPAAGSAGVARYGGAGETPVITDTDGHFTVEGLAEGEFDVRAYRKGGAEASAERVKTGTRDLGLKLAEGGSIAGTLTARGAPVERFTLNVRQTRGSFSRVELFFHAQGTFAVRDLPAGAYSVEAETPEGNASAELTLAEGEQKAGVALTLTLRSSVDGRLVDLESGAPVAGWRLAVYGNSSASIMNGDARDYVSGPDGRFHLDGVLAGTWSLMASSPDRNNQSVSVPIVVRDGGAASDVGAIRIPGRRLAPGEARGDLGVYLNPLGGDPPGAVRGVSGAAAEAGIQTGDTVVSVDGFDVQGSNGYLLLPLTTVAVGRSVSFGLAGGRTVSVVARGW